MQTLPEIRPTPRRWQVLGATPFFLVHLACFGAIWSGVTWQAVLIGVALYWVRMFGTTGGYHRYFAHRTYKTSRPVQFLLAFLAQTSVQKGALWWAAHHRRHHKLSDLPGDVHSPRQDGFWYAQMFWLFNHTDETDWARIKDMARYPELVWLNRLHLLPPALLALACLLVAGPSGLIVGFFWSTVVCWHCTFFINSLAHIIGRRRYETTDDSKNSLLLALLTMGEGWHNNHHHYQSSARQGFFWWEIDLTYYVLKGMERLGLIWDLRPVPDEILEAGRAADRAARRRQPVLSLPSTSTSTSTST